VSPVPLSKLREKNLKLMSPSMSTYIADQEARDAYVQELFELIQSGKVSIDVHKVYRLQDVGHAHADLEGRKTTGKLLLRV
jgi:NADPH2:quinone reductase